MRPFLLTSVQFITYPVQTSDSSLFNRFLTPYNLSTYSPSIAFLFRTNVRLTPLQPLSYPFNYCHSIAFLSTYNPPTYSPSIALLSTRKRPTYSPSIAFLLTYLQSSDLLPLRPLFKHNTLPLQMSDLPLFKRATYPVQPSDLPHTII